MESSYVNIHLPPPYISPSPPFNRSLLYPLHIYNVLAHRCYLTIGNWKSDCR